MAKKIGYWVAVLLGLVSAVVFIRLVVIAVAKIGDYNGVVMACLLVASLALCLLFWFFAIKLSR
jgi:hypothetical protein